jgi:uncharacterized coiled-coil protein SlyX
MKATAVEWLANRIIELEERLRHKEINLNDFMDLKDELVEQAKEIEKQKLEQFYNHGQWAVIENGHGECFDDYYNRIFKQQEQ